MGHIPERTEVLRGVAPCLGVGSRDRASLSEGPHMLESRGKKAFVRPLFDVPQVGGTHHFVQVQQRMVRDRLVLIHINGCVSWSAGIHCGVQRTWLDQRSPAGIYEQGRRLYLSQSDRWHGGAG